MRNLLHKSIFVRRVRSCGITLILPFIISAAFHLALPLTARSQDSQRLPGRKPLQTGVVAGTVTDQNGRPVRGARIDLHAHATQANAPATTTSGEGIYRLVNVPVGDYDVTVTADGAEP